MQAGQLTDIITFTRCESTRDGFGAINDRWIKVFDKRACVRFRSGARVEVNSEILNTSTISITIRYCKDVDAKMRIAYESQKYRIVLINRDRKKQSTEIVAEAINE